MIKTTNGFWFQPRKALSIAVTICVICLLGGCHGESVRVDAEQAELKKVNLQEIPGWREDNFADVVGVFSANCKRVLLVKGEYLSDADIKIAAAPYQKICNRFANKKITSSDAMRSFIEDEFDVYAVSDGGNDSGKITSYYEAVIHASFKKHGKYKYPVYGKPHDLVEINLRDFDAELPNTRLVGRVDNGKFVPYFNRGEIENNGIKAPVLMWGDDLVDIHFMQIQGSALAYMDDGTEVRIGYADNNGHKFRGIGSILLEKKLLKPGEASMPKIREWLRNNPQQAKMIMAENKRFIFQRINNASGPLGALGVPLTAGRSLAVDNRYIPLGAMMWLDTYNPDKEKIRKIVFAQDIGGAIKGVVRGDYFWGHGEKALQEAGRMNSVGKYYIFVPKDKVN